jgi:hypothetical protein
MDVCTSSTTTSASVLLPVEMDGHAYKNHPYSRLSLSSDCGMLIDNDLVKVETAVKGLYAQHCGFTRGGFFFIAVR